MRKIVLISCVSKKLNHRSRAKDLYVSPLFRKSLAYAKLLKPDEIFILSAKHGLLTLDEEVDPYNETLNGASSTRIQQWAKSVLPQLQQVADLNTDEFVFLAGNSYRKFLLSHIKHYDIPMLGLPIGKQLGWLTERVGHE